MTTSLISIDPGLRNCGVALWENDRLADGLMTHSKGYRDGLGWAHMAQETAQGIALRLRPNSKPHVAYEMPEFLPGWKKGTGNDVLQVAGSLGALLQTMTGWDMTPVRPSTWTRGRPKHANQRRVIARLSVEETAVLARALGWTPEALLHRVEKDKVGKGEHLFDAVAVGLFHLNRL